MTKNRISFLFVMILVISIFLNHSYADVLHGLVNEMQSNVVNMVGDGEQKDLQKDSKDKRIKTVNIESYQFVDRKQALVEDISYLDDFYININWSISREQGIEKDSHFDVILSDKLDYGYELEKTSHIIASDTKHSVGSAKILTNENGKKVIRISIEQANRSEIKGQLYLKARFKTRPHSAKQTIPITLGDETKYSDIYIRELLNVKTNDKSTESKNKSDDKNGIGNSNSELEKKTKKESTEKKDGKFEGEESSEENPEKNKKLRGKKDERRPPLNAVNTVITHFSITDQDGNPVTELAKYKKFKLKISWDASSYGAGNLKAGDYFEIKLPDKMKFPTNHNACNFQIKNEEGKVVANAVVSPNDPEVGGGKVRVTFTDFVENNNNIKGTMFLAAEFIIHKVIINEKNKFSITVGSKLYETDIMITNPKPSLDILKKYGYTPKENSNVLAGWNVRINYEQSNLKNAKFTDKLNDKRQKYIEKQYGDKYSFFLKYVKLNATGDQVDTVYKTYNFDDLISGKDGYKLTISPDKNSFKLTLGNIGRKQFVLTYFTTYKEGSTLTNKATLTHGEDQIGVSYSYKSSESGGQAEGELNNKIKIIKLDKDDGRITLAGAKFKIIKLKNNGEEFIGEFITNDFGEIESPVLVAGKYRLIELEPPKDYDIEKKVHEVEVKNGQATIVTITNKKNKLDLPITKLWYDSEGREITADEELAKLPKEVKIKLYRKINGGNEEVVKINGQDYVTVERDELNRWMYKYRGLPAYKLLPSGEKKYYTYRIEEVPLPGYENIEVSNQKLTLTGGLNYHTQRLEIKNRQNKYTFKIFKKDMEGGNIDSGAKFQLYKANIDQNGNITKGDPIENEKEVTSQGISYENLVKGVYILSETKAPIGYTKLLNDVVLEINKSGKLVLREPNNMVKLENDGNGQNNIFMINIQNRKAEYPATGGIGSPIVIVMGLILILAGLLVRRRLNCG